MMDTKRVTDSMSHIFSSKTPTKVRPQVIIETGTYYGLGTTQLAIEAVKKAGVSSRPKFVTIETNEEIRKQAMENLRKDKWIEVVHGCSVDFEEAIKWMKEDEYIQNPPDNLRIDSDYPLQFYGAEIKSQSPVLGRGPMGENNVLERLIKRFRKHRPLFILDSAGGIGYYEFKQVFDSMGMVRFYMFVRDIDHIKHHRTYNEVLLNECGRWEILDTDSQTWMLAVCKAKVVQQ